VFLISQKWKLNCEARLEQFKFEFRAIVSFEFLFYLVALAHSPDFLLKDMLSPATGVGPEEVLEPVGDLGPGPYHADPLFNRVPLCVFQVLDGLDHLGVFGLAGGSFLGHAPLPAGVRVVVAFIVEQLSVVATKNPSLAVLPSQFRFGGQTVLYRHQVVLFVVDDATVVTVQVGHWAIVTS
jgi:hypothetical protein